MDAVEFIKERNRMCRFYGSVCKGCPAFKTSDCKMDVESQISAEEQTEIVKKWSAAHQPKTRQSIFLSHYPKAEVDDAGSLKVCPLVVEGSYYKDSCKCGYVTCERCSKNYWSVIVEEEK